MSKNSLGREIPETFLGRTLRPYRDPFSFIPQGREVSRPLRRVNRSDNKLLGSLREAIEASGLRDGMTIGAHHHLRNGDGILNAVVKEIAAMGIRDIAIASSSVHPVHEEIVPYIRDGVITRIECGVNGPISRMASSGELDVPIITRSHGGRAAAMKTGDIKVDVSFLGAPICDSYGNICASKGPSAFGVLGYGHSDADYAGCVVAVTDNLVPYPAQPISIPQTKVDYVVQVESLGDPSKIVSTTTRVTTDPIGLQIAKYAIVVAPSIRARLPIIRDEVTTISTPGETIDAVVTERGVALNSKWEGIAAELKKCGIPVKPIAQLKDEIYAITGVPRPIEFTDKIVGLIEYRDGSITDVIRQVKI